MNLEEKVNLHEKIMALKEAFEQGTVIIAEHLLDNFQTSLEKIRYGDDGLINPETVDGRLRALSSFILFDKQRKEAKESISQRDIQERYFQLLDHYFGNLYELMTEAMVTPRLFAEWFLSQEEHRQQVHTVLPDFLEAIESFWDALYYSSWTHEEDADKSKAIFGGDILPAYEENVAIHLGLYLDTIIIFDPFLKQMPTLKLRGIEAASKDLIRWALMLMEYKPLVLADLDPPIMVVTAERVSQDDRYSTYLTDVSEQNTLQLLSMIFHQQFSKLEDFTDFLKDFDAADSILKAVQDPRYLVFEAGDSRPLEEQVQEYIDTFYTPLGLPNLEMGEVIYTYILGRVMQANALIDSSISFKGTPVIQAPTSWEYFNLKLDIDAEYAGKINQEKLHISRGLEHAINQEFSWLGNIPRGFLIELRKQGAAQEIRDIISKDIAQLIEADANNFTATGEKVINNLKAAFKEHETKLKELQDKQLKFFGLDVGGLLLRGTIAFAAAKLDPIIPVVTSLSGLPSIKDVFNKGRGLVKEKDTLNRTPVGMLVRAKR